LAWSLLRECCPEKAYAIQPRKVGLFSPSIAADPFLSKFVADVQHHKPWNDELAERRNPAAHRIPLTVPPQVLTTAQSEEYKKAWERHREAFARLDLTAAGAALDQAEKIGTFHPVFMHDPKDGIIPLYPTLPDDIGHMLEILSAAENFVLGRP
jgi:hypothetical protein